MKWKGHKNRVVLLPIALLILIGTFGLYYFKIGSFVNMDAIIIQELKLDDYVYLQGHDVNDTRIIWQKKP